MFKSTQTKVMSSGVRLHAASLIAQLRDVLSSSLISAGKEEDFLENLWTNFSDPDLLKLPLNSGLAIQSFVKKIHERPKVYFNGVAGPELGDLLVSVRYEPKAPLPAEEKAILYQVKVEQSQNSAQWKIASNQLDLLSLWPEFNLAGSATIHATQALTKEAASYLLLRKPKPEHPDPLFGDVPSQVMQFLAGRPNDASYGAVMPASGLASLVDGVKDGDVHAFVYAVGKRPSESVALSGMSHLQQPDVAAFFEHLSFDRG